MVAFHLSTCTREARRLVFSARQGLGLNICSKYVSITGIVCLGSSRPPLGLVSAPEKPGKLVVLGLVMSSFDFNICTKGAIERRLAFSGSSKALLASTSASKITGDRSFWARQGPFWIECTGFSIQGGQSRVQSNRGPLLARIYCGK